MAEYGRVGSASDAGEKCRIYESQQAIPSVTNVAIPKGDGTYRHEPKSVTATVEIKYDPQSEKGPFRYVLIFPSELKDFFFEVGLTDFAGSFYNGSSEQYWNADEAKRKAEQDIKRTVERYKNHVKNKAQATKYSITVVDL